MNITDLVVDRPSAQPAAAVLCVRPPFAGVEPAACPDTAAARHDRAATGQFVSLVTPRHGAGFAWGDAAATAHQPVELLAPTAIAVEGRSVSAPIGGYAATVQQMGKKQIDAGTSGVGGDPPRGRPN